MKLNFIAAALIAASPLLATSGPEFHYKTEMTGGDLPSAMTSETWVKGDRIKMLTQTPVGPSSMVVKDKMIYMRTGGMAMKMAVDQQKSAQPRPSDYAQALEQRLKGAKKMGTEVIDGEKCDKWHAVHTENGKTSDETLWVSPTLQFPRKVVIKTDAKGKEMTMHNTDIERTVTLKDSDFEPESGVQYMDMSEMLKRAQGGGVHPGGVGQEAPH